MKVDILNKCVILWDIVGVSFLTTNGIEFLESIEQILVGLTTKMKPWSIWPVTTFKNDKEFAFSWDVPV